MSALRRVRVYFVHDGDGHQDQMDEYAREGAHDADYYYADDVDKSLATLATRLAAAEKLLHDADAVIEILLGDFHHKHAEEVVATIAEHWNTYPEPLA